MDKQTNKAIITTIKHQRLYRAVPLQSAGLNDDDRKIHFSFSTETPIMHSLPSLNNQPVYVVLGHKENEINLAKLNKGRNPILLEHDPKLQVGVVDGAAAANGIGEAWGRVSRSALGSDTWQDIKDGIKNQISVGTTIQQLSRIDDIDGIPAYRATQWTPFELSVVSLAADESVGIYRCEDFTDSQTITNEVINQMDNLDKKEETVVVKDNTKETLDRAGAILDAGMAHGEVEMARDYIKRGLTINDFNQSLLEKMSKKQVPIDGKSAEIGLSPREVKRFSVLRAINAQIGNRWDKAGFELECSRAVEKQFGVTAKGFYIPMDVLHRDLDWTTEATDLVKTNLLTGSFIDLLYKKTVMRELGATFLEGIVGNIDIPRMSGGATVYWAASEQAGLSESTQTFDKISLSPKSMGCVSDVSKLLLNQTAFSAEQMLLNDMARAIAVGIDTYALSGSGISGQPTGLLGSGITADDIGTSTGITYADIVSLESSVATQDADIGALAYLTTPKVRGKLKQVFTNATYGSLPVWGADNMVNGYRGIVSNVVPSTIDTDHHVCVYGNWADLIICLFAPGLDVTVDPFTLSKTRLVSLICYMDIDFGVRHVKSFAYADNIKNSGL